MTPAVAILGSGKMARNVGAYFLGRGARVAWVASGPDRGTELQRQLRRVIKRQARSQGCSPEEVPATVSTMQSVASAFDVVIESSREHLQTKRSLLRLASAWLEPGGLLLSNSSSFPPERLHPECVGMHFFYPVELTGFVEIVVPPGAARITESRVIEFARESQLNLAVQRDQSAFAANRLMLPLQCELFRLLQSGVPAQLLDDCSASPLLPVGQASLMDSVGLDLLLTGATNYTESMSQAERDDYRPLLSGLTKLVGLGKLGKKNDNGLLVGKALPWGRDESLAPLVLAADLRRSFEDLLVNTCFAFVERGWLSESDLTNIIEHVFQGDVALEELVADRKLNLMGKRLEKMYAALGLSYLRPCSKLLTS